MQIGWSTLAFASGTVATGVVALTVMSLDSQSVRDNAFHVCVGKDRVLKLVETEEPCPEGQQRLRLQEAGAPDVEPPKDTGAKANKKEDAKSASKVQAPFEVVDANGRTIIRVDTTFGARGQGRGIQIYGTSGQPVAYAVSDSGGHGVLRVDSASGQMSTGIFAYNESAGLRVKENDKLRVDIGRSDVGSYAARFYSSGTLPMAGVGIGSKGTPYVQVTDGTAPRAALVVTGNRGQIELDNSKGQAVATFSEGTQGGGKLQLTDGSGTPMVEAGTAEGVGVVRAGPTSGPAYMVGPAILVSRIVGKK
jgi:hypothetical protein